MDLIARTVLTFTIFIIFATFHEYAHGWMAYRRGDPTAKQSGRLSLNPIAHIDIVWTIILPAIMLISSGGRIAFGSAKPVPVNPYLLRDPKRDMIWIGLAGPATNVAWIIALIIIMKTGLFSPVSPVYLLLFICMYINMILLVFNMIPIPPLDGSRVVEGLLPDTYANEYARIKPYGFIILLILIYFGVFGQLFSRILYLVMRIFAIQFPLRF
jgi:Zn-dependent protease